MPWLDNDTYELPRPIGLTVAWLLFAVLPMAAVILGMTALTWIAETLSRPA